MDEKEPIEQLQYHQWSNLLRCVFKPSEYDRITPLWEVTRGRSEKVDILTIDAVNQWLLSVVSVAVVVQYCCE